MKDFAEHFYKSTAWKRCRRSYLQKVGGLCERCLAKGLYKPAVIVHHKVYLDPQTINNPEIALSYENLEALCRECHEDEHTKRKGRYRVDEWGKVTIR